MINSTVNKCKRLKVDTEGELQPSTSSSDAQNLSQYQGIQKQLNIIECDIKQQTINIHCNSATFTTDVAILETCKILFPVSNGVFAGRDSIFDELIEYLAKSQLAVICGMAGIGKTECSKKFAWNNSSKYGMKLWINTDSEQTIQKSVNEIARKLSITVADRDTENIINDVYDYFEKRNIFTLFVFDNANDRRSINSLLPSKANHDNTFIHIIITSQNSKWGKRNGKDIPKIELKPLETIFAVDVFREILEDHFDDYELALWENLAEHLNKIPLALQITAAYVKNEIESIEEFGMDESFSLREYIKKLEEELHLIIDEPFPDDSENAYPQTIYIAVAMTLDKIKTKEQFWQSAFDLLYAISYLNPNYLHHYVLVKFMPEEDLRKSLVILTKFSLIFSENYKQKKKIGIHRLVQWILRYHQKKSGSDLQIIHYKKVVMNVLHFDETCFAHHKDIIKFEMHFSKILRDFFLDGKLYFLHILIQFDGYNSLSLILDALGINYIDEAVMLLRYTMLLDQVNCVRVLLNYFEKLNVDFDNFKTIGRIFLFGPMRWLSGLESTKLFLEKCKDLNVGDGNYTPIMWAIEKGYADAIKIFIETKRIDLNYAENNGWTAFHYLIASSYFNQDNTDLLPASLGCLFVKAGAKLDVIDVQGRSLLHQACRYPSPSYIDFLIRQHKLDVNFKDEQGIQPIILLFEHTSQQSLFYSPYFVLIKENILISCLDVMIKNGADITATNQNGKTILHLAARYCPLVVEYLIKTHKMDVNIKDTANQTPLFDVKETENINSISNTVKCLIDNGARININDSNGFSPQSWALKLSRHKVAEVLATYSI